MTRQRDDNHSTEFGLWLRSQREIDSSIGYLATNIDYLWANYKTGKWMLIEEKRYMSRPKVWQHNLFQTIHNACKNAKGYNGIHLIQFEKTSPDDGKIYLDLKEISKEKLIKFLKFEL